MNISNQETEQRLEAILDLTRGYRRDTVAACLYCIHCAACFDEEQIYPVKGGMVTAARAAREHVEDAHGGAFTALLAMGKQTTGLTEIQETLLRSFREPTGRPQTRSAANRNPRSGTTDSSSVAGRRRRESSSP
jgi:hypothetical protein